jgi:hypothetical protein
MKKSNWLSILVSIGIVMLLICWGRRIQHEYVNACRVSVYDDLTEIRRAILVYQKKNDAIPQNLQVLVPAYLSKEVVDRKARTGVTQRKILVPASPYGLRHISNNPGNSFDIICTFYGKGYTGVVMHAQGEIGVE